MRKMIVFTLLLAACALPQGCISLPFSLGNDRGKVSMEEIEPAEHFWTTDEVLLIPLTGLVDVGDMSAGLGGGTGMLVALKDRLKAAEDNPRIKAIVLRIDSPGGSVTAADLIYHELLDFKAKMKKKSEEKHFPPGVNREIPIIAIMTDVAASGGLYIAMAADEIYALPTTVTGSIGVIMMLPGLEGLAGKIGFDMRVIKSGANKDLGSMWRAMTPEERAILQGLIDQYYRLFFQVILDGRQSKGLTAEKLKPLADGRVLDAQTAKSINLIDGIMYPREVFERAKAKANLKDARIISYEYPFNYRGNIYARSSGAAPQMQGAQGGDTNLLKLDLGGAAGLSRKPQFMYLWMP